MFLERDENLPLLYQSFTGVHHKIFHMLVGLNRIYYCGFKWMDVLDARLEVKPKDFLQRARLAYKLPPQEGAREVIQLVDEVYDLVEYQLPEADVKRLRKIFHYERPLWHHSPCSQ